MGNLVLGADLAIGDMIYYVVLFGILLVAIKKFAWGPVTKIMDARAKKINDDIDAAEKANEIASTNAAQTAEALAESKTKAVQIMNTAKENGEKTKAQIVADAQSESERLKTNAQKDIEQAKQEALNDARNQVAELSVEIASKLIQKELKTADQAELIDSYIDTLGKNK